MRCCRKVELSIVYNMHSDLSKCYFLQKDVQIFFCKKSAKHRNNTGATIQIKEVVLLIIEKKLINKNYSKGVVIQPQYIVIHETDNTAKGANADAHYKYWNSNDNAKASAHFVVDDTKALQLGELNRRMWHVGDNKGYSPITNSNSIGVEICVNSDGDYTLARRNAIELVRDLMKKTGIEADHVVRHNDASGKHCPRRMMDNPKLWEDFKKEVSCVGVKTGKEAIDVLVQKGIINSPEYWHKAVDVVKWLDELLINFANRV